MKRRCEFLDNCPAFNFNPGSSEYLKSEKKGKKKMNDTSQLGSTLMETMISEVSDFCDPFIWENWALKPHHQVRGIGCCFIFASIPILPPLPLLLFLLPYHPPPSLRSPFPPSLFPPPFILSSLFFFSVPYFGFFLPFKFFILFF